MLKSLRRLLSRGPRPPEPTVLQQWAERHGHHFLRVRGEDGCVVQGRQGPQAWRVEWGQPQRDYIPGFELRLLADLDLPRELSILVLNRLLMEQMEKSVYEQYVDDVQTRIDTETPAEMRWLVMYPKLTAAELGRLRDHYGAAGSLKPWLLQWLDSPLGDSLVGAAGLPDAQAPLVLTVSRGRLTLRTAMAEPDEQRLATWFSVFEHALREAGRLGHEWRGAAAGGLTTQPSAWSSSVLAPGGDPH